MPLVKAIIITLAICLLLVLLARIYLRGKKQNIIVFFHPNLLDCGGGERVLWAGIEALCPEAENLGVYSEDCCYEKAQAIIYPRFSINCPENLKFFNVGQASFITPGYFKHFTLLLQALGSMVYAFKCLFVVVPSIIIDTTGAPFAAPIWKFFGGSKVISYTHYPFISTDMLKSVETGKSSFNNNQRIAKSAFFTKAKLIYYRIVAKFYAFAGRQCDLCMANSSWTAAHLSQIFGKPPTIVFPPCDVDIFSQFPLDGREKALILSIGQYRPEKNIPLQLSAMEKLSASRKDAHLIIVGGCRNQGDEEIYAETQKEIDAKGLPVKIMKNVGFEELKSLLGKAEVGLHTMYNEHFGICVVEYEAAGLIPVSNKSGGPLLDIVQDERFLASSSDEYAEKLSFALDQSAEVRRDFREKSQRFSAKEFAKSFVDACRPVIKG